MAKDAEDDANLEDAHIFFDMKPSGMNLRSGEQQIDTVNRVEDTKGNTGVTGVLVVTNLRLMWYSTKSAKTNLSIGFGCVDAVSVRTVELRRTSNATVSSSFSLLS